MGRKSLITTDYEQTVANAKMQKSILNTSSSPQDQLLELKVLTQKYEILHEFQVTQLRLWPFVIDPKLENVKAEVDFDKKRIFYTWARKPFPNIDKKYQKRLSELEKSIKQMLGDDWTVEIQELFSQKAIFRSEDAPKPTRTHRRHRSR